MRPAALSLALLGSVLHWLERLTAGWFGPKGFALVLYAILILDARVPHTDALFHLAALVIAGSIIAHSSTDHLVARWYEQAESGGADREGKERRLDGGGEAPGQGGKGRREEEA